MSSASLAIEVRGLVKTFEDGRIRALNGVDLDVPDGAFISITGPSGCGKSTLLHLIAGLDRPTAGSIRVHGRDLESWDLNAYRAREIGLIFQLHNLLPTLTASENVQMPMFGIIRSAAERRDRAYQLLELVGLSGRDSLRPPQLSGGERQRVAIARALANDPHILLADEPTGSLDSRAGQRILDLIEDIQRHRDLTVVLVTHDPAVARRAGRIVRMLDGRIVGEDVPAEVEGERSVPARGND